MAEQETLKTLGAAIQQQRKQLGLSQTEVADLAGVSLNFVSQIETGKATAQIGKVLDLVHALGLQFALEFGKNRLINRTARKT